MEEDAPPRHSVSELAGRFKGSAPPHDAAGREAQEKPVRRRPPRSLQLSKTPGDEQEQPAGVTSPLQTKAKRNSALIEKLQANLALSPSALQPSPKSPGFRLLPPSFPPPSPSSTPVTTVTTSTANSTSSVATSPLTEEEGPASFEAPPTVVEGCTLSNINKGRARHSSRRRPPSRRHRKSSSGDEVGVATEEGANSVSEPEDKTTGSEEFFQEEGKSDEAKEDKTEKNESHKEDQSKIYMKPKEEDEKEEEEGGDGPPSGRKEEAQEKKSGDKQQEDSTEGATKTEEEEKKRRLHPDE